MIGAINFSGKKFLTLAITSMLLLGISFFSFAKKNDELKVLHLRTEYKVNPLGIGETQPRLSWELTSNTRRTFQTAYQIIAAASKADLDSRKNLIWDTKKVDSDQSIQVAYKGSPLKSQQRVWWKVKVWDNHGNQSEWSDAEFWEAGLLDGSDWKASWISPDLNESDSLPNPCPYLRREFSLKGKAKSARIYISSHGLYQLFLNGNKVSEDLFSPGWTSYNNRLQYQTYDVSKVLQSKNALGIILGDGWYRGQLGWDGKRNHYGDKLAVILQLEVEYEDGSKELISSDENWKASTGPIQKSEIYDGELYDARLKKTGWNSVDYDDSSWNGVIIRKYGKDGLAAQIGPPVQITETIKPVRKIHSPSGELIFDMGQNMVGWVEFKLSGKAGSKITLCHAEVLDKDGNFYTENLRGADQKIEYIFSGSGTEIFEPHFTFQGFRYVKVENYEGEIGLDDLAGKVIHSAMEPIGDFECSDTLINQLQHNIKWGLKGNFLDVPTDCPQRDERLGWTGDAQAFAPTACFIMDVSSFYTKWLRDVAADQDDEGRVPFVVPDILNSDNTFGGFSGAATGWADVATVIPWTMYEYFGDKNILKVQYPSMKAWVDYMKKQAGDSHLYNTGFHFGDWLSFSTTSPAYPGAYTDTDLIATAYFYHSATILYRSAEIVGNVNDAQLYKELATKIKKAFQNEFLSPSGRLSPNTQTAYVLALGFGLIPDELIEKSAKRLANDVKKFGHITTGFLGTPLICQVLSDNGYPDLAYQLLFRKEYPGWLYPVTQGATTIWERWDGQKPDGTFQDAGMNSFNHYAYGAVGKWLYSYVAGIKANIEHPGYKKIIIDPLVNNQMTYAEATHHSMYGKISSKWEKEGTTLKMHVIIPTNTIAEIHIPTSDETSVVEGISRISDSKDISLLKEDAGGLVVEVGSGEYLFTSKIE